MKNSITLFRVATSEDMPADAGEQVYPSDSGSSCSPQRTACSARTCLQVSEAVSQFRYSTKGHRVTGQLRQLRVAIPLRTCLQTQVKKAISHPSIRLRRARRGRGCRRRSTRRCPWASERRCGTRTSRTGWSASSTRCAGRRCFQHSRNCKCWWPMSPAPCLRGWLTRQGRRLFCVPDSEVL